MQNKLTVRIAEGLGNQLFMYAHSYALSKKIDYKLIVDDVSGYFKKKDIRKYELDNFNISALKINVKDKFDSNFLDLKRKTLKKLDFLNNKKKFLIEKKDQFKKTFFYEYNLENFANKFYVEGNFESEKYFNEYKKDLLNEFKIKNEKLFNTNSFFQNINNNDRIVSICVRQNRFSERIGNINNTLSIQKSNLFTKETIDYIYRAITFFEKKIENPIFYVWSNDFSNLKEYFPNNKFRFVDLKENKTINDFFLLLQCKNFIVGPTSFHWWGAWLSNFNNKICTRPKNLNPSNNSDFWPESWIDI
tara:strand:+ start:967 stop:1878 length:912 start_codon:yes stop_codon:yes gene_type:complete